MNWLMGVLLCLDMLAIGASLGAVATLHYAQRIINEQRDRDAAQRWERDA